MDRHDSYYKLMRRREIPGGIRFIMFCCQRRLPLLTNRTIARLLAERLQQARIRDGLEVFAWVLMPEHVHLLCRLDEDQTLERSLRSVKMSVAKRVLARWHEARAPILARVADATSRPRFWQKGGGFDRNVRSDSEFMREIHYIHHNPVERGLVGRCQDYEWSSVHWWMGNRSATVLECDPPPGDPRSWERWREYM